LRPLARTLADIDVPCYDDPRDSFRHEEHDQRRAGDAFSSHGASVLGDPMRIGVVFPQLEIGTDPTAIRDFAVAAEEAGYAHMVVFDHVLGIDPNRSPEGWRSRYELDKIPYNHDTMFHEPFVLFGYLASLTTSIDFMTGVLVLPQRQTALVAKQAAEVDLLSGGRLVLGVGVGWNPVEFQGMESDYRRRGRRIEEQIALLRRFWSEPVVDFSGDQHRVDRAGINPRPSRQIPIWIGGSAAPVLERAGRLGDGWHVPRVLRRDPEQLGRLLERVRAAAVAAGRDPTALAVSTVLHPEDVPPNEQIELIREMEAVGVTHLAYNTIDAGLRSPAEHVDAIRDFAGRVRSVMSGLRA
jgi:probable F420-dependent oxidoreductase